MIKKPVRPTIKLTGAPFDAEGAQRLNRRRRRVAAGRLRRDNVSADPLATFLRTRRGWLSLLGGILLFAIVLFGLQLARL